MPITEQENASQQDAMSKYSEAVSDLAKNKRKNLLHNEGNAHALIIFTNIFRTAEEYIRIVAKDLLNTEVANKYDYIESLKSFLSRSNTKLEILLSEFDMASARNTPLFSMIANSDAYKAERVVIKNMNGKAFRDQNGNEIHFCVADDRIFRIETDIKARKALCNFNDPEQAKELNEKFTIAETAPTTTLVQF